MHPRPYPARPRDSFNWFDSHQGVFMTERNFFLRKAVVAALAASTLPVNAAGGAGN
jgi:hypothetical protein